MKPPRLAARLLGRALPRGPEGDTIRGDLVEEFNRRAQASRLSAAMWYWVTTASLLLRYRAPRALFPASDRQGSMDGAVQDLRYAVRMLWKARAFTGIVIVTLALGIGANTAIFSALNAVLLEPLPYPNAARLVRLEGQNPQMGLDNSAISAADFLDWRRDLRGFEELAAFSRFSTTLPGATPDAPAERIATVEVDNLFHVLGVGPVAGRDFAATELQPGSPPAAIISSGFWEQRFGGKREIVGQPLRPGSPAPIVGVVPSSAAFPEDVNLWVPAVLDPSTDRRNNRVYEAIGLLRPGVTVREAQAELDTISARLENAFPSTNRGWRVRAVPLLDDIVGESKRTLYLLLGAVGLVMLIACANVASLFVAQAASRQREIAVRSAIGAGRARIFRQVLTESVLLSVLSGIVGLVVGYWVLQLLIAIGSGAIPRLEHAGLDRRVLVFSLAISVVTGVGFGVLPALQLSRFSLVSSLREGSRGAGSRGRTRATLVIVEVALATMLLAGAGLLGRSFQQLRQVDVGFQPANLLTMRVSLSGQKYRQPAGSVMFFNDALARITALPGVRSAAAVLSLPINAGGFYLGRGVIRPGLPYPEEGYNAMFQYVTPGYFATLGTPLLRGRDFDARDTGASPPVAIINRALAEQRFAGENPLGQKILVWKDERVPREIIGVAGDLKSADLAASARAEIFVPHAQGGITDLSFVIRTTGPPAAAAAPVRAALQAVDPTQAAYAVRTMESAMGDALAQQRFSLVLFAGFAALSLALVAVGLYGVMMHAVNARTHEMGVRLALGARPSDVRALVVRHGLVLLAIGLALGIPGALAGARLLGTLLYGVTPSDPLTTIVVIVTIALVTVLSAYVPARRATRVDPASVLRQ